MKKIMRILTILVATFLLAACDGGPRKVYVGAQSFTEQAILSQMLRQLVEDRTGLRAIIVECGDAYGCTQALYLKRVDLMVGYSGTGLMYSPSRTTRHTGTLAEVRRLYENSDVAWLDGLGYESGYQLVVPRSKAREFGLATIADLAKLQGGVRVASPQAFLDRFGDGLPSLVRHYGIRLRGEPIVIEDPVQRVMELFRRGADVAIVTGTAIPRDPGLMTLRDNLGFFPRYEAALVARKAVMASRPELSQALGRLKNRITTEQMRQLVSEVLVNGWAPGGVARQFLQDQNLLARRIDPLGRRPVIEIALAEGERRAFEDLITIALRAVRHAFPSYPVKLVTSNDPVKALAQGRARLALIGAERFFRDDGADRFAIRETRIEAAAVVGTPYLHILRRPGDTLEADTVAGRVGVPPRQTAEARVAMAILEAAGKEPAGFESADVLLEQVANNQLDAALIFRLPGDAWTAKQIAEHALELYDLPPLTDKVPPFLQPARLPARTYPGQDKFVSTVGVQILIAGPAPHLETGPFAGSPAAAIISQGPPLTLKEARAMEESVAAVRSVEPPHPVLPSVWLRSIADEGTREGPGLAQAILDTSLNIGVIVFLGWVLALVIHRPTRPI